MGRFSQCKDSLLSGGCVQRPGYFDSITNTPYFLESYPAVVIGDNYNLFGFENPFKYESLATSISDDKQVIVGQSYYILKNPSYDKRYNPVRWIYTNGKYWMDKLDDEWGINSEEAMNYVNKISGDGRVIAGTIDFKHLDGSRSAFKWTEEGGLVSLGTLHSKSTCEAKSVSDDGQFIVGYCEYSPFIWSEKYGMSDIMQILDEMKFPIIDWYYNSYGGIKNLMVPWNSY